MKIYFLNGELSGTKVLLADTTTIGRDPENVLVVPGLGISRFHATIVNQNGVWKLIDGGSTNGCSVNHQRVKGEVELKEGDIIELGNQSIRFGEVRDITKDAMQASGINSAPVVKPAKESQNKTLTPPKAKQQITFQPQKPPPTKIIHTKEQPIPAKGLTGAIPPKAAQPGGLSASATPKIARPNLKSSDTPKLKIAGQDKKPTADVPQGSAAAKSKPAKASSSKTTSSIQSRELSEALKNGKIALFQSNNKDKHSDNSGTGSTDDDKKSRFSNLLFYAVVMLVAVIAVTVFIKIQERNNRPLRQMAVAKKPPSLFLIVYEKTKLSSDNIFRFYMKVENRQAYFVIDDLKSQRSYEKHVTITQQQLDDLKNEVEKLEIMGETSPPPGVATNELDETKHFIVSYNGKLCDVSIVNNSMPIAFIKLTAIIDDFIALYGLQTISMTPKELREKATEMFNKAESLFRNRDGNPANLRDAVARYKIAEEFLSQFSPKPPMWSKAKKGAIIAEEMRVNRLKALSQDLTKYKKLGEYEKCDEILTEMMQLAIPGGKDYRNIRREKINNDEKLARLNR